MLIWALDIWYNLTSILEKLKIWSYPLLFHFSLAVVSQISWQAIAAQTHHICLRDSAPSCFHTSFWIPGSQEGGKLG